MCLALGLIGVSAVLCVDKERKHGNVTVTLLCNLVVNVKAALKSRRAVSGPSVLVGYAFIVSIFVVFKKFRLLSGVI